MSAAPRTDAPRLLHLVYADWCGHCVPTAIEPLREVAAAGGFELRLHDIDTDAGVAAGDDLVKSYGDWSEDYMIPQIFVQDPSGPPRHVFTGYSEGARFTRRGLENLRARGVLERPWPIPPAVPGGYTSPLSESAIQSLVTKGYLGPGSCLHCEEPASFERVEELPGLVFAQVCPSRYVTRIVGFSARSDPSKFLSMLQPILPPEKDVSSYDVRIASRYDWDLGEESGLPFLFQQTYWNQYYENTHSHHKVRSDDPNRLNLFRCEGSPDFFAQNPSSNRRRCGDCETHGR